MVQDQNSRATQKPPCFHVIKINLNSSRLRLVQRMDSGRVGSKRDKVAPLPQEPESTDTPKLSKLLTDIANVLEADQDMRRSKSKTERKDFQSSEDHRDDRGISKRTIDPGLLLESDQYAMLDYEKSQSALERTLKLNDIAGGNSDRENLVDSLNGDRPDSPRDGGDSPNAETAAIKIAQSVLARAKNFALINENDGDADDDEGGDQDGDANSDASDAQEKEEKEEIERIEKQDRFDGDAHLNTLQHRIRMQTQMYEFQTLPVTQILGGLKDPGLIATVQINQLKYDFKEKEAGKDGDSVSQSSGGFSSGRISMSRFGTSLKSMKEKEKERIVRERRRTKLSNQQHIEFSQKIDKQFVAQQQRKLYATVQQDDADREISEFYCERADEEKGNQLVEFGSICSVCLPGKWQLKLAVGNKTLKFLFQFKGAKAKLKTSGLAEEDKPDVACVGDGAYQLTYKGETIDLVLVDEDQSMELAEGAMEARGFSLLKFQKLSDFNTNNEDVQLLAQINIWTVDKNKFKMFRQYQYNNPHILRRIFAKSRLDQLLYKSPNGNLMIMTTDKSSNEDGLGMFNESNESVQYLLVDQSWPEQEHLPILEKESAHLNFTMESELQSNLTRKLEEYSWPESFSFVGKYYQNTQFFHSYKYLAVSGLQKGSRLLNTEQFYNQANLEPSDLAKLTYELTSPYCELILGVSKDSKYLWYLANTNKPKYKVSNTEKEVRQEITNAKRKGTMLLAKYSLQERKVIFLALLSQDRLNNDATKILKDAFQNKNDIVPLINCDLNLLALRVVPNNALLSFKLPTQDQAPKGITYDSLPPSGPMLDEILAQLPVAELLCKIDVGDSLQVLMRGRPGDPDLAYYNVGRPKLDEKKTYGLLKSKITLTNLCDQEDTKTLDIKIEREYFDNTHLDHAISYNAQGQLVFAAISRAKKSDGLEMHLSISNGEGIIFMDCWTMQAPFIAYRRSRHSVIQLINTLRPESPQLILDLYPNEVKAFVQAPRAIDTFTTAKELEGQPFKQHLISDANTNFVMLVSHEKKMWLACLSILPYVTSEKWFKGSKFFILSGQVQLPVGYESANIVNAQLIRSLNQKNNQDLSSYSVMLQYKDSIWCSHIGPSQEESVELVDENSTRIEQVNFGEIAPITMVRGYNDFVYFIEQDSSRAEIVQVSIDFEESTIKREVIYRLSGATCLALEVDPENDQRDTEFKNNDSGRLGNVVVKQSLLVFDSTHKLHHLVMMPEETSFSARVFDMSHHDFSLIKQPRFMCTPLSLRTVTYGGVNFSVNSSCFWRSWMPTDRGDWKHIETRLDPSTKLNASLYFSPDGGEMRFVTRSSPSSKQVSLTPTSREFELVTMMFVTNTLTLCKIKYFRARNFQHSFWIVLAVDGQVVPQQNPEVQVFFKDCPVSTQEFSIKCNNFTNVDDTERRIVVFQRFGDFERRHDAYVVEFDDQGQAYLLSTIPKQNVRIWTDDFPLVRFNRNYTTPDGTRGTPSPVKSDDDNYWFPQLALRHLNMTEHFYLFQKRKDGTMQQLQSIFKQVSSVGEKERLTSLEKPKSVNMGVMMADLKNNFFVQMLFEAPVKGVSIKLFKQNGYSDDQNMGVDVVVRVGESPSSLQEHCKFSGVQISELDDLMHLSIPPTEAKWLKVELQDIGGKETADYYLGEVLRTVVFCENTNYTKPVRDMLMTDVYEATSDVKSFNRLNQATFEVKDFEDWSSFSLPTKFILSPMVYAKQKIVVWLGDIQSRKIPKITWQDSRVALKAKQSKEQNKETQPGPAIKRSNSSLNQSLNASQSIQIQTKQALLKFNEVTLIIQRTKIGEWIHFNILAYVVGKKHFSRPMAAFILLNNIYMHATGSPLRNLVKLTVTDLPKNEAKKANKVAKQKSKEYDPREYTTFKLLSNVEFPHISQETPVQIDRVHRGWITKLRRQRPKFGTSPKLEFHEDLMQLTFEDEAYLYFHDGKHFVEINQIDSTEHFTNPQQFIPIGCVATHWEADALKKDIIRKVLVKNNDASMCFMQTITIDQDEKARTVTVQEGPYSSYDESDVQNLVFLRKNVNIKPKIDLESLLHLYEGYNAFAIFYQSSSMLKYILAQFSEVEYDMELNLRGEETQPSQVRRLMFTLLCPIQKFMKDSELPDMGPGEYRSVIRQSFTGSNLARRDLLLQMANLCSELTLIHICENIKNVIQLIGNNSPVSREVLKEAFIENSYTRKIEILNWNKGGSMRAFLHQSSTITSEQAERHVSDPDQNKKSTLVEVRIINLRWLFQDGNTFGDLVSDFIDLKQQSWFGDQLLLSLFKTFWHKDQKQIKYIGFVPYCVFLTISTIFTGLVASAQYTMQYGQIKETEIQIIVTLGSLCMVMWLYTVTVELLQLCNSIENGHTFMLRAIYQGLKRYTSSFFNFVDFAIVLTQPTIFIVVVQQVLNPDSILLSPRMLMLVLFSHQVLMWLKLFDWLRLFNKTSIFSNLLSNVISDIIVFLMIVVIILILFANGLYLISSFTMMERKGPIYPDYIENRVVDSLLSVFLLMLGEFSHDFFSVADSELDILLTPVLWVQFLLAIILTNIIFLNVLIAIISDTFERVWEKRQMYNTSSSASLVADWLPILRLIRHIKTDKLFMVVITPTQLSEADNPDEWQGKIASLKKQMTAQFDELTTTIKVLKRDLLVHHKSHAESQEAVKSVLQQLQASQEQQRMDIHEMKTKIEEQDKSQQDATMLQELKAIEREFAKAAKQSGVGGGALEKLEKLIKGLDIVY